MQPKICSNCGLQDHYEKEISAGGGLSTNLLPLGFASWLSNPKFRLRICGTCGLTDWFVAEAFLSAMRDSFDRVQQ